MQPLGERLGQPVGERLGQDRRVVVVRRLEAGDQLVEPVAGGDRERPDVVRRPAREGATKSASARFGRPSGLAICWRRVRNVGERRRSRIVGQSTMSSPGRVRRPEADDRRGPSSRSSRRSARAAPGRRRTGRAALPDRPGRRGSPGTRRAAPRSRRTASSRCARRARRAGSPSNARTPRNDGPAASRTVTSRCGTGFARASASVSRLLLRWRAGARADLVVLGADLAGERLAPRSVQQRPGHAHRARRVEHVDDRRRNRPARS